MSGLKTHFILVVMILITALAVIYAKHHSRKLFTQHRALQAEADELNIEWGQLLLEQGVWAAQGRVEQIAHEQLKLHLPAPDKVIIVTP